MDGDGRDSHHALEADVGGFVSPPQGGLVWSHLPSFYFL